MEKVEVKCGQNKNRTLSSLSHLGVSVVIVTHARPDMLQRTLDSLSRCDLPEKRLRTIVIENGSKRGAKQIVKEAADHLNARYIFVKSRVKSVALNRALDVAGDDLVVFLDDDVRVAQGTLEAYCAAANETGLGHYFGGPTDVDYEEAPPSWLKQFLPASATGLKLHKGVCFLGFNWAAFAGDLKRAGGYNPGFGPGTETGTGDETSMQWRLQKQGCIQRWVEASLVWHYVPKSRCSPAWALKRTEAGGFHAGILHEFTSRKKGQPLGMLYAYLQQFRRRTSVSNIVDFILLRKRGRVWLQHVLGWLRGFKRGVRYGKRAKPLDNESWNRRKIGQLKRSVA